MNTSMKRRGGVIALAALVGAAIGSIQAPITGAVILLLLTAGGLFLLSRIRLGPM